MTEGREREEQQEREKATDRQMKSLEGSKVLSVSWFDFDSEEGYIIAFDNGLYLTATYGEYGEDAMELLSEKEAKRLLRR